MGVWEGLSPSAQDTCDVPGCTNAAITAFLPAFESPGGWSGDHQEYDPNLNIAFICKEHQPERFMQGESNDTATS